MKGSASLLCGAEEVSEKVVPGLQGCVMGLLGPLGTELPAVSLEHQWDVHQGLCGPAVFTYSGNLKADHAQG